MYVHISGKYMKFKKQQLQSTYDRNSHFQLYF